MGTISTDRSNVRNAMLEAYNAQSKNMVRIDPSFTKLVTALKTATTTLQDNDYAKDKTSWLDVLDAFLQVSLELQPKS